MFMTRLDWFTVSQQHCWKRWWWLDTSLSCLGCTSKNIPWCVIWYLRLPPALLSNMMRILKIFIMKCRSCTSEDTNWPCIASLSFPRQLSKHSADGEITMSASLNHATWFVRKNQWNILVGFIVNHFGRLRIRFLFKFICSESVWSNFIRALKHSTKTHATPWRCQTKPTSCQKSVNLLFL